MYVLVTYDVADTLGAGSRRLAKVAKICERYGQRVQQSVFECSVTPAEYELLKHGIIGVIDEEKDTVRLYNLGNNWENRVDHIGSKVPYNPNEPMIL
jgi:CRISPR-associated protein Cas2